MARVSALAAHLPHSPRTAAQDVLRLIVIGGCALALIVAGRPLPF